LTGSAQFNGKIDIVDAKINANLGVTASAVGFPEGTVEKLNATLRASKIIAAPKSQLGSSGSRRTAAGTAATARGPWFADLHTAMEFGLSNIHYRD